MPWIRPWHFPDHVAAYFGFGVRRRVSTHCRTLSQVAADRGIPLASLILDEARRTGEYTSRILCVGLVKCGRDKAQVRRMQEMHDAITLSYQIFHHEKLQIVEIAIRYKGVIMGAIEFHVIGWSDKTIAHLDNALYDAIKKLYASCAHEMKRNSISCTRSKPYDVCAE
jgi:hypothetical protein